MKYAQSQNRTGLNMNLDDNEPIVLHADRGLPLHQKNVNYRWLAGIILICIFSILLIGGALYTTFNGRTSLTSVSDSAILKYDSDLQSQSGSQKKDRQIKLITQVSDRQELQISKMKREGERENVVVRPFALVTSTLHTRKVSEFAHLIPPFNPVKLAQIQTGEIVKVDEENTIYNAKIEGDVSISILDFPMDIPISNSEFSMSQEEIDWIIQEEAKFISDNIVTTASLTPGNVGNDYMEDSNSTEEPTKNVRIMPENVTFLQKSSTITGLAGIQEIYIIFEEGENLEDILQENGVSYWDAESIVKVIKFAKAGMEAEEIPTPGQRIRLALAPDLGKNRHRPIRVSIYSGSQHVISVAVSDNGKFVKANEPSVNAAYDAFDAAERATISGPTPSIYHSFYQTALQQEIPDSIINELIRLYMYDVDFNSPVKPGDKFEVLYGLNEKSDDISTDILFTSLSAGGKNLSYYRFRAPESGVLDYFDESGKSASKFLIRKPITNGVFKSGFGMRRHPILGYRKMHTGVDWASTRGSKILAAGDGIIEHTGWSSGYGHRVEIRHANGYRTTYSHLTEYAKGIKKGERIKQGELIGFVGSTGLSTGPHLHYEVRINNRFVDPMRMSIPRVLELEGEHLSKFKHETSQLLEVIDTHASENKIASQAITAEPFED